MTVTPRGALELTLHRFVAIQQQPTAVDVVAHMEALQAFGWHEIRENVGAHPPTLAGLLAAIKRGQEGPDALIERHQCCPCHTSGGAR